MKKERKLFVVFNLCLLGMLAQVSASWGVSLATEAQIDTITISSSLGITFGDIATSASGSIYSNGSLVANDSATGAGSFTTGVDGSVGPLSTTYSDVAGTQFAYLGTLVSAAPAAANPDPLANPLASDFVVLGNSNVSSLLGGTVTATDTANYTQTFTVNGSGAGTMTLGALGLYNFMLFPDDTTTYTARAEAWLDFLLSDGSSKNYQVRVTNPLRMFGQDVLMLGTVDSLTGLTTLGDLFGTIDVFGGQTWTLTATAGTLAEVTSVPEPSAIILFGGGLLGILLYRRRKGMSTGC
ncbi:PEP-CTERM sorting domain-containing protein [Geobacter sp. FeAm09]|uniref:PEP-CTERM sorting domain-containing protein n=1 Tax=Geobacter sp. FeAm09 TaxID=2597769 RepID=UPI0011EC4947|nr:PEP-CTERM sorting domain-containing protein [Geobacter sp. FeAm09]QEM70005.1 PEP-CTERM sorting domain-containing protein [Geobacter sp. FeAm09]